MRKLFGPFVIAVVCLGIGCKRSGGFEVPAEVGRGLSEADSLRALWSWLEGQSGYAADTLRMYVLYQLIDAIISRNPDSAYILVRRLEGLARSSSYSAGSGLVYLSRALIYSSKGEADSVIFWARQALSVLDEGRYGKLRAQALNALGLGYRQSSDYDSALTYCERAGSLFRALEDNRGLAVSYNNIGNIYSAQGRYAEALEYYQKALRIREALGDKAGLADSYNNIGVIYFYQGRYVEGLEYYQKALRIREALGDKARLAMSYHNIGTIYSAQGRYVEGLEYYQKALRIREALGDKAGLAALYNNVGLIYSNQGRYAEALEYHQKSLRLEESLGNKPGLAALYNNVGLIYSNQRRYAEALEYYQKALRIREALGDKAGLAALYNNIGLIYSAQGRHAEALEYYRRAIMIGEAVEDKYVLTFSYAGVGALCFLQGQPHTGRPYLLKALTLAHELNAYDRLREIYLLLCRMDSALAVSGKPAYWKTAYEYAHLHSIYKDSVMNEESIRRQAQLESQYEYEKKVALLKAQQEKERALSEAEKRRREVERNFSLAIAGIAVAGSGILLYFLGVIRRQKRELEAAKEGLEVANRELEVANAELRATNQALEESNRVIQAQAELLAEKNEEILDSIRYAERIQRAILPSEEKWRRLLPDSFVVYLPRDIVAGDFYWVEETERYVFLGVADATGHGVPGAFVSLVCANALNKAVIEEGLKSPADILTRAKEVVSALLTREGGRLADGMDIALVRFEKEHPWRIVYAGANRPLWIVSYTKELIELSPTRQPVGYTELERPFEEVAVDLGSRRPVMVYGFTDGIVDQMGGPKGRKLMAKGLREFLLGIADLPCEAQRERIEAFFAEWKGEMRQMDDVTVVGLRVG